MVLFLVERFWGQDSDVTSAVITTVSCNEDLLSQVWFMEDATPLKTGQVDIRLGFGWVTESGHANLGESSDDFVMTPAVVWGAAEDLELSLSLGTWLGDGGDMGPFEHGNYDSTLGVLWRIHKQGGKCSEPGCIRLPSIAMSASAHVPTGCSSSGVDGELRLILTNQYDSGIRSHFNAFAEVVDGSNEESVALGSSWVLAHGRGLAPRDFQWGVVLGADSPLCADGAVRWVADYMHRSSEFYGRSDMDILESGWEWTMSEVQRLAMSMQIGMDHTDDNPNFGVGMMYAFSIGS